jgi:hypothetical protein
MFLAMRNVLDKVVEKIKTHILYSLTFFSESRAVYEILSKSTMETTEGPQMMLQYGAQELHSG